MAKIMVENGQLKIVEYYHNVEPYMVAADYQDKRELFWKCGIEFVDIIQPSQDILDIISDSYASVNVQMIIKIEGQFYRSIGTYTSYGYDEWSAWEPVQEFTKTIKYYE